MAMMLKNLIDSWKLMYHHQTHTGGFDPTMRELMEIFQLGSTSAVSYRLKQMEEAGLVRTRHTGKTLVYRAKEHAEVRAMLGPDYEL